MAINFNKDNNNQDNQNRQNKKVYKNPYDDIEQKRKEFYDNLRKKGIDPNQGGGMQGGFNMHSNPNSAMQGMGGMGGMGSMYHKNEMVCERVEWVWYILKLTLVLGIIILPIILLVSWFNGVFMHDKEMVYAVPNGTYTVVYTQDGTQYLQDSKGNLYSSSTISGNVPISGQVIINNPPVAKKNSSSTIKTLITIWFVCSIIVFLGKRRH